MSTYATPLAKRRKAENPKLHYNIGLVGSGNMARALVEGITTAGNATWRGVSFLVSINFAALRSGQVLPSNITASATSEDSENYIRMKVCSACCAWMSRDF